MASEMKAVAATGFYCIVGPAGVMLEERNRRVRTLLFGLPDHEAFSFPIDGACPGGVCSYPVGSKRRVFGEEEVRRQLDNIERIAASGRGPELRILCQKLWALEGAIRFCFLNPKMLQFAYADLDYTRMIAEAVIGILTEVSPAPVEFYWLKPHHLDDEEFTSFDEVKEVLERLKNS
jgi:hypothetical protein